MTITASATIRAITNTATGTTSTYVEIENDPRVWHNAYHRAYTTLPEPFAAEFNLLVEDDGSVCRICRETVVGWDAGEPWAPTALFHLEGMPAASRVCTDCLYTTIDRIEAINAAA
jgi:hypothetical protein